jgi:hypothetical protein
MTAVGLTAAFLLAAVAAPGRSAAAPFPAALGAANAALSATVEAGARHKVRRKKAKRHRHAWRKPHGYSDTFGFLDYPFIGFANPAYRLGLP